MKDPAPALALKFVIFVTIWHPFGNLSRYREGHPPPTEKAEVVFKLDSKLELETREFWGQNSNSKLEIFRSIFDFLIKWTIFAPNLPKMAKIKGPGPGLGPTRLPPRVTGYCWTPPVPRFAWHFRMLCKRGGSYSNPRHAGGVE